MSTIDAPDVHRDEDIIIFTASNGFVFTASALYTQPKGDLAVSRRDSLFAAFMELIPLDEENLPAIAHGYKRTVEGIKTEALFTDYIQFPRDELWIAFADYIEFLDQSSGHAR